MAYLTDKSRDALNTHYRRGPVNLLSIFLLVSSVSGLSACMSSFSPVDSAKPVLSEEQLALAALQADLGKQHLFQTDEGQTVSVPTHYPEELSTELALESANTVEGQSESDLLTEVEGPVQNTDPNQIATTQEATAELALVVPQPNPFASQATPPSATPETAQLTANKVAIEQQATKELKRPSFLVRLFKRPSKNVGVVDDRKNPILLSSRTVSASNRGNSPVRASLNAIPGVRTNDDIFGIKKNLDDAQDRVQLASAAGMARLSPLGLRTQHSRVNVSCIRPEVLQLVNIVERRYGKKPIVTSGYRTPSRNRKAGGARNSMHIYCKAVDIQVEGVSKWNLAKFMRTIPGRGGVGTYCRTKSVHIDIGPKRDWHYSCRRKSKRRHKS